MSDEIEKTMEKNKRLRKVLRAAFTRIYNSIQESLDSEECVSIEVRSKLNSLNVKMDEMRLLDKHILDCLLDSEIDDQELDEEVRLSDEYFDKLNQISLTVEGRLMRPRPPESDNGSDIMSKSTTKNKLKLPTIEFKKFNGDLKDWLPFWAQFKRIDEDENIDDIDKYHYLVQATVPNSRARQIVESYPDTSGNYSKALQSLKSRFGRDDLLIEVYIRELLKLVLSNLNSKVELSFIYDRLETQLRALETLGVASDKCSAILYPLIESCIPEEILRAWQRHSSYEEDSELKDRLDALMKFLQKEVTNEERILLASSGFENSSKATRPYSQQNSGKTETDVSKARPDFMKKLEVVPTATGLVNRSKFEKSFKDLKCIFCCANHLNENCKESSMSVEDKLTILGKNGCCFVCTKYGHRAGQCRVKVKCSFCSGRHASVICKESFAKSCSSNSRKESNLANNVRTEVFLQTVLVKLRGHDKERTIRAIFDTGSQRSYILKSTANEFNYVATRKEKLVHALFGGTNSETTEHTCYKARLGALDDSFSCNFDVLDEEIICSEVTAVKPGPWTNELEAVGINIKDADQPIEVLIGADVAGKLYTGKRHMLTNGLVAMHTLLGWTIMGKVPIKEGNIKSSSMTVTSLLSPVLRKTLTTKLRPVFDASALQKNQHSLNDCLEKDWPLRGCFPEKLLKSRWWEGPQWLRNSSDLWSTQCQTEEEKKLKNQEDSSTNIYI